MPRPAFPTGLRQFQQQFPDEAAWRECLETFRWPDGFRHNARLKGIPDHTSLESSNG